MFVVRLEVVEECSWRKEVQERKAECRLGACGPWNYNIGKVP